MGIQFILKVLIWPPLSWLLIVLLLAHNKLIVRLILSTWYIVLFIYFVWLPVIGSEETINSFVTPCFISSHL